MAASYPTAPKTFTNRSAGQTVASAHINDLQDEVNAIETGLLGGGAPVSASNATFHALNVTAGSTLASLSLVGPSTIASTLTIGTLPYVFPSSGGSTGQSLAIVSTNGATMTLEWRAPNTGVMTLLKEGSGTDTTVGATNVDTIAISGLTVKDKLFVVFTFGSTAQATGRVDLVTATDSNGVISAITSASGVNAAETYAGEARLQNDQSGTTAYVGFNASYGSAGGNKTVTTTLAASTAWTGSWTLALRHNGVTSGGTFRYRWAVYKVAGQ